MTPTEASRRLAAFKREHGAGLLGLASHAALPVVLNVEIVHLLRINYFLDPPHTLPYTAEASLLLSSMCTEIDDGLYVIDPAIRDLLLATLVEKFTPARVRDVARLIWEYGERGAPWGERPGLAEAQQLTALNFIDPPRALGWLRRARRGEGALPINDDRWFVVLERDLRERTAAMEKAEGEAVFLGAKLPALTALRDVVVKLYDDPRAGLRVAQQLGLALTGVSDEAGSSRAWQAILDAAWIESRMPDLLEVITADLKENPVWTNALAEYWFQLSPALRVVDGHFTAPPPEWQALESLRPQVESALGALAVIFVENADGKTQGVGMGCLVGNHAVLTHKSMLEGPIIVNGRMRPDIRVFAAFAPDTFSWSAETSSATKMRLELTDAVIEPETGLGILTSGPDRTGVPEPLRVMTQPPSKLKGRKVYAMGYPSRDDRRIEPSVLARAMGDVYSVLRIQPGEILGEETSGLLNHNCLTAGGNGGSPLVDLQTGLVIGLHFAGLYEPGPRGFKRNQAIAVFRLAQNSLLIERGVFGVPTPVQLREAPRARRTAQRDQVFVNRQAEQDLFLAMIAASRGGTLFVEGPAGVGKTALLRRLSELAEEHGLRTVFLSAHDRWTPFRPEYFFSIIGLHLGLPPIGEAQLTEQQIVRMVSEATERIGSFAVFIDEVDAVAESLLPLIDMIQRVAAPVLFVVAGRFPPESRRLVSPTSRLVSLGPLDRESVREWLVAHGVEEKDQTVDFLLEASKGDPSQLFKFVSILREVSPQTDQPQPRATQGLEEHLSTLDVMRPDPAVVFQDDPSETHGPFVLTRGSHSVALPARFRMATTPVTNAAFAEFIRAGGYDAQEFWPSGESRRRFRCKDGTAGPASWGSASTADDLPRHPVAGVCYHEAIAFVAWLERTVAAPENMHWCVPTEDMWEFAARGTSGLVYPWGHVFEPGRCNSREMDIGMTSEVGRFPGGRSPFGMDDMAGNVWEFVRADDQDLWGCVLRGGSFTNNHDEIKASLRLVRVPRDHRPPDFGFRCALTSDIVAEPGTSSENQRPAQNAARSTVRPRRSSRHATDGPTEGGPCIYDSTREDDLTSWVRFSSIGQQNRHVSSGRRRSDGVPQLTFSASGPEFVGVNKQVPLLLGRVHFEYQVVESSVDGENVAFFVIPMQAKSSAVQPLEVGSNSVAHVDNQNSPHRIRSMPPREHAVDRLWHTMELAFDFRSLPDAAFAIFGPRLNEGTRKGGSGRVSIANVRIYATEAQAHADTVAHERAPFGSEIQRLAQRSPLDRSETASANKTREDAIGRLVDEYNQTRAAMQSSPARTQHMEAIVAKIKIELAEAPSFDALAQLDSADKGWRLVAYAFIQLSPVEHFFEPLCNSLKKYRSRRRNTREGPPADNRPFGEYHGLLALEAVDRQIGAFTPGQSSLLKAVIQVLRPGSDSDRERVISRLRSRHPELNSPPA